MALSTIALTTVSGVKEYRGMPDSTDDDALLANLINRVTVLIETVTDRTFVAREFTETTDGLGNILFPNYYPVTTISGIWDDPDWIWPDTTLVDSTYYRVVDDNRVISKGSYFSTGVQNMKVTYTAGYDAVPYDVEQACTEEVVHRYDTRKKLDLTSRTLPDGTSYFTPGSLLPQVMEVLKPYMRKEVV